MLKTAVIGLGDISKIHIPVLQSMKNVEICAVCDIQKSKANVYQNIKFYESASELLKEAKPDVVHVCLPHYLHYPMALLAAQNNVNVFCEKPLALNGGEAEAFANLEINYPCLKFGLCLQNRYNKSVQRVLEIIKSDEHGKLIAVKGIVAWCRNKAYYDAAPWRGKAQQAGGGVLINQAIHTLDLMQLFAGNVKWIKGSVSRLFDFDIEVEDTASASIMFENGAQGVFFATNTNAKNSGVELELVFENAEYLIKENCLFKTNKGESICLCEDDKFAGTKFYYGSGHTKAIAQFYKSLENSTNDYINARQGVISMKMIDAVKSSSISGEKIIFQEDKLC